MRSPPSVTPRLMLRIRNHLPVPSNNHLFVTLNQIKQLAEPVFRLKGADLLHPDLDNLS
jgi:hypothetical protein